MSREISLREDFSSPQGLFAYYDANNQAQRDQLAKQHHVDIRTFYPDITTPTPIIGLDGMTMTALDAYTMTLLESFSGLVVDGEEWSAGTYGQNSGRRNFNELSLLCNTGTTTTSCVTTTVDLSGYANTDYITVALPAFPNASVTKASSFIDFTSDPAGSFAGSIDSVAFSTNVASFAAGDSEFRFPISLLVLVNRAAITGVRFRITTTSNVTVIFQALRAITATWTYAPVDIDTKGGRLRRTPTRTGAATAAYEFPNSTRTFPITFRSDDPSSSVDPRPVDTEVGVRFKSGLLGFSDVASTVTSNVIALYFRELGLDPQTQLDLDGLSQGGLEALTNQPDYNVARFTSRLQSDLDLENQTGLDADTQFDIEHVEDYTSQDYIEIRLEWGATGGKVYINTANVTGYTFTGVPIFAAGYYYLIATVEDETVRVKVSRSDAAGTLGATIYDTGFISDATLFPRRRGRFGWWTQFVDGDSWVEEIRPRKTSFGRLITAPHHSLTPVVGATLDAAYSSDKILFNGVPSAGPWGGTGVVDATKSPSGQAFKISGTQAGHGIQTGLFEIDDFASLTVEFDIFFPAYALSNGLGIDAFLYGSGNSVIPVSLNPISTDQFSPVRVSFDETQLIAGDYRLVVVQGVNVRADWWVDNFDIRTRSVVWSGRGKQADPWGLEGDQWIPFRDTVNILEGGVLFPRRGRSMQVMGEARRHNSFITEFKTTPKYAEKARLFWPDEHPVTPVVMTVLFSTAATLVAREWRFDGTVLANTPPIVCYHWSFGDGRFSTGPIVTHRYREAGTYTVTLTAINAQNQRGTFTQSVVVT